MRLTSLLGMGWFMSNGAILKTNQVFAECPSDANLNKILASQALIGDLSLASSLDHRDSVVAAADDLDNLLEVTIPVNFQVLRDSKGVEGHIPYEALLAQIDYANNAYDGQQNPTECAKSKIKFVLQSVSYWDDTNLFENCETIDFETLQIRSLLLDYTSTMNVFTCKMVKYSGWAWPCFCSESWNFMLTSGAFVDYRYFPAIESWDPLTFGGKPERIGDTWVHEVGHALGLFHPSNNGCSEPGDYVDDTPAEATMYGTWGKCPSDLDTCPDMPGKDMVTNFMDYADDQCRTIFTEGQVKRMHWYIDTYMPTVRSMRYQWQCVAMHNFTPNKAVAFSVCKSACFRGRTPSKKKPPANGWCYFHGGASDQTSNLWGECVCPGSPKASLALGAPRTAKTVCVKRSCATSFWSLGEECVEPMTSAQASAFCTSKGYQLCTAADAKLGIITQALSGSPCQDVGNVWMKNPCKRGSRMSQNLVTKKTQCLRGGLATPVCCFKST